MRVYRSISLVCFLGATLATAGCGDDSSGDDGPDASTGASSTGAATGNATTDPQGSTSTDPGTTGDASTGQPATTSGADSSGTDSGSDDSSGTGAQGLPDIDMSVVLDDTIASVYTDSQMFGEGTCEVVEGCVHAAGERRLLRFDTITPNLGPVDFYVGTPEENPDAFEIGCGGGPVFQNYAAYRLLSADGKTEISTGHKAAFALIDVAPWTEDAGPAQYGFGPEMGISSGWADIYGAGLGCQYVDITDVPSGDYQLEISINFEQEIEEETFDNNILLVPVTITDGNTGGAPNGWVCPGTFYDSADGCDCGCGLVDPDCADATVGSCTYCDSGCAETCEEIDPVDNSQCL